MKEINIGGGESGQRLDKYLLKFFNKAPKSFIYKMLRKKRIKLNSKRAEGNEMLAQGDTIQLYIAEDTMLTLQEAKEIKHTKCEFEIVFEDENLLLVNKPVGLLVQADNSGDESLNEQLLYYLYNKGEYDISKNASFKPGISNRLDRNTSGIVAMGKNLSMVQGLNEAFKNNSIDKYYLTVVKGEIAKGGSIIAYHKKNEGNNVVIYDKPTEDTKKVETLYKPLNTKDGYTLLEVKLITGKSHQIRASLAHIGYPVVGDRKYGEESVNRIFRDRYKLKNQILHAYKLVIKEGCLDYLGGREFIAEPMGVMKKIIDDMR